MNLMFSRVDDNAAQRNTPSPVCIPNIITIYYNNLTEPNRVINYLVFILSKHICTSHDNMSYCIEIRLSRLILSLLFNFFSRKRTYDKLLLLSFLNILL